MEKFLGVKSCWGWCVDEMGMTWGWCADVMRSVKSHKSLWGWPMSSYIVLCCPWAILHHPWIILCHLSIILCHPTSSLGHPISSLDHPMSSYIIPGLSHAILCCPQVIYSCHRYPLFPCPLEWQGWHPTGGDSDTTGSFILLHFVSFYHNHMSLASI